MGENEGRELDEEAGEYWEEGMEERRSGRVRRMRVERRRKLEVLESIKV